MAGMTVILTSLETKIQHGTNKMKITKRQLRRIIKEEKRQLLKEQESDVRNYRVTMLVAVLPGQEEYILESIEQGMEFMEGAGEGILEYNIQEVPQ